MKPWTAVANSDAYRELSEVERKEAKRQYFESVVAPRVPDEERAAAWGQFESWEPPALSTLDRAGAWLNDVRSSMQDDVNANADPQEAAALATFGESQANADAAAKRAQPLAREAKGVGMEEYLKGFDALNPKADDYDREHAAQLFLQQREAALARKQASQDAGFNNRFDEVTRDPVEWFNRRLDERLAGPDRGVVPKAPTTGDMQRLAASDADAIAETRARDIGSIDLAGESVTRGAGGVASSVASFPEAALKAVEGALVGLNEAGAALGMPEWMLDRSYASPVSIVAPFIEGKTFGSYRMAGTRDIADTIRNIASRVESDQHGVAIRVVSRKADDALEHAIKSGDTSRIIDVLSDPRAWAVGAGQAAPSLLASIVGGLPVMMAMEGGSALENLKEYEAANGGVEAVRAANAVIQTTALNTLLEKLGVDAAMGKLPKAVQDKIYGAAISGLQGRIARGASYGLIGGAGEAGTEGLQGVNENLSARWYNPDAKLTDGVLLSVMGGAGSGASAGSVSGMVRGATQAGAAIPARAQIGARVDAGSAQNIGAASNVDEAIAAANAAAGEIIDAPQVESFAVSQQQDATLSGMESADPLDATFARGQELGAQIQAAPAPATTDPLNAALTSGETVSEEVANAPTLDEASNQGSSDLPGGSAGDTQPGDVVGAGVSGVAGTLAPSGGTNQSVGERTSVADDALSQPEAAPIDQAALLESAARAASESQGQTLYRTPHKGLAMAQANRFRNSLGVPVEMSQAANGEWLVTRAQQSEQETQNADRSELGTPQASAVTPAPEPIADATDAAESGQQVKETGDPFTYEGGQVKESPDSLRMGGGDQAPAAKFIREGDFWNYRGQRAREIARALDLTVTERGGVPQVGIPAHSLGLFSRDLKDAGITAEFVDAPSVQFSRSGKSESNRPVTPDDLLTLFNEAETIEIKAPEMSEQEIDDAEASFLSDFPEGSRYTRKTRLLERVRRESDRAFVQVKDAPGRSRRHARAIGPFSGYETRAEALEPDSFNPNGALQIEVFGDEQVTAGLDSEPALTITVTPDGDLTINGPSPAGETFREFQSRGWADRAKGAGGEVQPGWSALKDPANPDKTLPIQQIIPLLADVHARVRAWRGEDYVGLHWSRATGAMGGLSWGDQDTTAVFFSRESATDDQFRETERAYGGREGYDRAKSAGKTKLNYRQWVQVRTPNFKAWFGDWESAALRAFLDGPPLQKLKTSDAPHQGFARLRDWAVGIFGDYGNYATNETLGRVLMDERAVRDSMGHRMSPFKAIAFKAVPDVIERGKVVHSERSGNVDSFWISAPVEIDGTADIVTVMVRRDPATQRMYLHSVATKEYLLNHKQSGAPNKSASSPGAVRAGGIEKILHGALNFNGDVSKVTDPETGEPLVVYHGTTADFDAFDNKKTGANDAGLWGRGHYFSSSVESANSYALRQGDGARIIPAYISITNPLILHTAADLITRLPDGTNTRDLLGPNLDGAKIKAIADAGGHDGVIQYKPNGSIGDVVAFRPEQIKSATGNKGDFDGANPEINRSFAGRGGRAADRMTRASFRQAIADRMPSLSAAVDRMLARGDDSKKGGLVPIDSGNEMDIAETFSSKTGRALDDAVQMFSDTDGVQGIYDPRSGVTFMIMPHVTSETAPAVLLHEMIHGQQRADIDAQAVKLLGQAENKLHPEKTRAFLRRVNRRIAQAGETGNSTEAAAYIVEQAVIEGRQAGFSAADGKFMDWVDATLGKRIGNILRDFVAMIRGWAIRRGAGWNPTVDDLVAIAMAGVKSAARGDVVTRGSDEANNASDSDIQRSIASITNKAAITPRAAPSAEAPVGHINSNLDQHGAGQSSVAAPPSETTARAVQRRIQDKFNRFTVIQDWLKDQGVSISEQADVYRAEERMHGRVATRTEDFREHRVGPLIKRIRKAGLKMSEVADFLHAQHAEERNQQIATINSAMQDGGSGMTTAEARRKLAEYRKTPQLVQLANELRAITDDTRKILLDSGIISQEIAAAWQATYANYVPLKGGPDDAAQAGTGRGLTVRDKQKRALGHGERAEGEWIIENILRDHERAILMSEKNRIGQHLLQLAADSQALNLITIDMPKKRSVLRDTKAYEVRYRGAIVEVFSSLSDAQRYVGQEAIKIQRGPHNFTITTSHDLDVAYMASPILEANETQVYVAGHSVRIQFNDDLLARAWNNLGAEHLNAVFRAARAVNTWLSKAYTGYNPEFLGVNVARDFTAGLANMTGEEGAAFAARAAANYPKAFAELLRYAWTGNASNWIKQYRADGGTTGAAYLSDMERLGKDVQNTYDDYAGAVETWRNGGEWSRTRAVRVAAWKAIGPLIKTVERLNQAGENAMRLAAYRTAVESGISRAKAASIAKNSTINFNRRGEVMPVAGSLYLFLNPAVQGTSVIAHALFKGKHKHQVQTLMAGIVGIGYMVASSMGWGPEDEWEKLHDSTKDRYLPIWTGSGYSKIPIPYGYGFFFNLGRHLSELESGKAERSDVALKIAANFMDEFTVFSQVTNPDGDERNMFFLLPTVPQIIGQPLINQTGLGGEIYPASRFDGSQPDNLKMWRSTQGTAWHALSKALNKITGGNAVEAGWLDVSPETFKYLWNTTTGGAGKFVTDSASIMWNVAVEDVPLSDLDAREIPLVRKFYQSAGDVRGARARFWDAAKEVKSATEAFARMTKIEDALDRTSIGDKMLAERRELLAIADVSDWYIKAIAEKRDAVMRTMADKSSPLPQRRLHVREIEAEEVRLYDEFVALFKKEEQKRKERLGRLQASD